MEGRRSLLIRRIASVMLGGVFAVFIGYLHTGGPADPFAEQGDYPYKSSRTCQQCHPAIYEEWASSSHARSWKDPLVRKLSRGFGDSDCIPCHAPQPLLINSFDAPPLAREKMRKDGVDCLSCHRVRGGVASSGMFANAPCRPMRDERVRSVGLCRSCHNLHGTVDDWAATPLKEAGKDCVVCHMPLVQREGARREKSHRWPGGHVKQMIARAVQLNARVGNEKGIIIVEVDNTGAGHNVPTELRHRALDLQVTVQKGWFYKHTYEYRFRNPYKGEGGLNTQLKFGERRLLIYPIPSGKGEVKIRLVYRLMPYGEGSDGEVIREISIPFYRR